MGGSGGGGAHFTGEIDRQNHEPPAASTLRAHKLKPKAAGRVLLNTGSEIAAVDFHSPELRELFEATKEVLPPVFKDADPPPMNCSIEYAEMPEVSCVFMLLWEEHDLWLYHLTHN